MSAETSYDVVIVGGGPAGLQAALVLGRMRRSVVVCDSGDPANAVEHAVSGLLSRDGTPPPELRAIAREQIERYPTVEFRDAEVTAAHRANGGFAIELGGERIESRKLLLAHGLHYGLPDVPGVAELWGERVFHCPYCHGWEVRDQRVAILATSPRAVNGTLLLCSLTDRLILLTGGSDVLDEQATRRLDVACVDVVAEPVERIERAGEGVRIELAGAEPLACDAVFVQAEQSLRTDLAVALGAELDDGGTIAVDASGGTGVPGLRAAGDAALPPQSAAHAIGTGAVAAYALNAELALERFERDPELSAADPD